MTGEPEESTSRRHVFGLPTVLTLALLVHMYPLFFSARHAFHDYALMHHKSETERRRMIFGQLYTDIETAAAQIPESATIWWVSPHLPWHHAYFLYPRILRWGSPHREDLAAIRHLHPTDWVMGWMETPNGNTLSYFPPLQNPTKSANP